MEDLDDSTQSSEGAWECSESSCPNDEAILLLIEQLRMECKDSDNLLKIQDTVHSYKRLIQCKDSDCEVLTGKLKTMENQVSGLEKKLTEAEHDKVQQEQELCNLRFALKQEEERRKSAEWICAKMKEQLREKAEQWSQEVEKKEQLDLRARELDVELKTVRSEFNQGLKEQKDIQRQLFQEQNARILQDEILAKHLDKQKQLEMAQEKISSELHQVQAQHAEALQSAEKMQDPMQKFEFENQKLKVKITKQAEKIEQLKKNLLSTNLNEDLTAKLETTLSKCSHLDKENQILQQELSVMNSSKKKCEKLRKRTKKLEREVANLQSYMENNMIDCSQIEQYKLEFEEQTKQDLLEKLQEVNLFLKTQATYQEKAEKLICKESASLRSQMELRIKGLESELFKMKSQVDADQIAVDNYKQLYLEEVKLRKSLSNKLSKTDACLAEVMTKLLLVRQQKSSHHSTLNTRPAPKPMFTGDLSNTVFIPRSFSGSFSRENLVDPISNLWPSIDIMHNYKTMVLQEWEQSVTRELRNATAGFESVFFRTSPPGIYVKSQAS